MAVMDDVVEFKVIFIPVMTSVMVMRYSLIIPLMSAVGGGFHDKEMEVELTGANMTFWGGLDGAERKNRFHHMLWRVKTYHPEEW